MKRSTILSSCLSLLVLPSCSPEYSNTNEKAAVPHRNDSMLFSSNQVGNGGDVVRCGQQYQLLDFYEGMSLRNLSPQMGEPHQSVTEKVTSILDRLASRDLTKSELYRSWLDDWGSEARIIDVVLEDIPDSGYVYLPGDCSIKQIAVQKEPQFDRDPRYIIDKNLWEMLEPDHQAGLILHELVYRHAIQKGHINSISTRYFVAWLASSEFENLSQDEYNQLAEESKLDGSLSYRLSNEVIFSYHPTFIGTFSESQAHCDRQGLKVGNLSWLMEFLKQPNFKNSPLAEQLLQDTDQGEQEIWGTWDENYAEPYVAKLLKIADFDFVVNDQPNLNQHYRVVCTSH